MGGGPTGHYFGAKTWDDPGSFANGFKGVCSVFVTAAFSFGGTELVGLAAAEAENPRLALPAAIKQVFWRVVLVSPGPSMVAKSTDRFWTSSISSP